MKLTISRVPYKHREAARTAMIASAALGPLGAFAGAGDMLAVGGIWSVCLVSIAAKEGVTMDKDTALGVCKSILLGVSGYYAGCKVATSLFNFIPGAGTVVAMGASSIANVIFTYRFVLTLCSVFEKIGLCGALDLRRLTAEAKAMFKGNGLVNDVQDIVSIYRRT